MMMISDHQVLPVISDDSTLSKSLSQTRNTQAQLTLAAGRGARQRACQTPCVKSTQTQPDSPGGWRPVATRRPAPGP
eukprot:1662644-Rhodomonas_salina.1